MTNPAPRISEAEWEIMKVVWAKAPISANEVVQALISQDRSWHPKTVKTYLSRLVSKGVLSFHKEVRAYVYSPVVTEQQCIETASQSFLERVFGGSLRPMLAHFVGSRKLSAEEINELKRILDGKETT